MHGRNFLKNFLIFHFVSNLNILLNPLFYGEKQSQVKIKLIQNFLNLNVEYIFSKGRGEAIQEFSNLIILLKQKTWNSGETD